VITDKYDVLAFGVKIRRAVGSEPVDLMVLTEPILGNEAVVVPPVQRGGTGRTVDWHLARHLRDAVPRLFLAGGLSPENVRAANYAQVIQNLRRSHPSRSAAPPGGSARAPDPAPATTHT